MKYIFIVFASLLLPFITIAQQNALRVSYIEEFGSNDSGGFTNWKTDLTILDSKSSLYRIDIKSANQKRIDASDFGEAKGFTPSNSSYNSYYKKNNNIFYKWYITGKKFYIKDQPNFEWKILPETKDILGYTCQKAVTTFRGRNYEAYFAIIDGATGGPWKFNGLPGVILEIESIDGEFKILSYGINTITLNNTVVNPYEDENFITWEKYKDLYNQKYIETENTFKDGQQVMNMKKMQRERLVD
ncbi:GLPGLI family protein [Leeuwenhoekiella marinoflava]|uniref:GLPGLI family protein n=2 Tax=Leeuwenhoekiella marinoflava TaxID=988 RepID=A0A4Q0PQK5_9FLAO|nr:GLPGLI family protein [Leeuwenhoekiella marinoflava]RXG32910.1 GLPGLI family protein [Leeuwenhoekiella marinoflava]SHE31670.1 GLPGLI family protein [Leeuwenhoekiella marinoflava DSM 3653]